MSIKRIDYKEAREYYIKGEGDEYPTLLELKKNEYKVNLPKGQIFKEALHRTG